MSSSEEEPALHHPLLEEVFTLLETAKQYEHSNQRIEAATKYYESCYLMRQILAERHTTTNTDADDSSSLSQLLTEKIEFYNTAAQQLYFDDRSTAPTATSKPLPISIGVLSEDDISVLTTPTTLPTTNNNTAHCSITQTPSSALASTQVVTNTRTITGTVLTTPTTLPTDKNNNNMQQHYSNNTTHTPAATTSLSSPQVVVTTTTEKGIPVPCDEHQLYDMMNRSMKSTRQHSFVAQPHTTPPAAETGGGGGKESGRIVYSPTTTKKKRSNSLLFSSLPIIREPSPPTPSPSVPGTHTTTNMNMNDEYVVVPSVPNTKLSPFPSDNDDEICRRASIANAALQQTVDYDETTQHPPIPTDVIIAHYLQAVDLYLQAIHLAEHSSSDSTAFSSPYHLLPKLRRRVQLALDRIEVLKQQQQHQQQHPR